MLADNASLRKKILKYASKGDSDKTNKKLRNILKKTIKKEPNNCERVIEIIKDNYDLNNLKSYIKNECPYYYENKYDLARGATFLAFAAISSTVSMFTFSKYKIMFLISGLVSYYGTYHFYNKHKKYTTNKEILSNLNKTAPAGI